MEYVEFKFGTKAETLKSIGNHLPGVSVSDVEFFTVQEWQKDSAAILSRMETIFEKKYLAIRSSAINEDGLIASHAGAFTSVLNARLGEDFSVAVEKVIESYQASPSPLNQILVMAMIEDVAVSGVIMTRVLDTGAPYYVLNYDDVSGATDTITSGAGTHNIVYVYHEAAEYCILSARVKLMVRLARDLEGVIGKQPLDIEFAIDRQGQIWLLQVRTIPASKNWPVDTDSAVAVAIPRMVQFVDEIMAPQAGLRGSSNLLSNMSDWNPAEIIGERGKPLALSLYRYLITDEIWRTSREFLGYRSMPSVPLMLVLASHPYIDVRASLNSFLPAGLSKETGEALVNAMLARLRDNPTSHDKLEFEIAHTVHELDFDNIFQDRYGEYVTTAQKVEFKSFLQKLTNILVDTAPTSSLAISEDSIESLMQSLMPFDNNASSSAPALLNQIRSLLDDARNSGAFYFSILARHAFIAETLLRGLVAKSVFSKERMEEFKRSISTITAFYAKQFKAVNEGKLSREGFLQMFGHLRPGTYDIMSPAYHERQDVLFSVKTNSSLENTSNPGFKLTNVERKAINSAFQEAGLSQVDVDTFLDYARRAIKGREYAKYVFTIPLSRALDLITLWGRQNNLSRQDLAMLDIREILDSNLQCNASDQFADMRVIADAKEKEWSAVNSIRLSAFLRGSYDVFVSPVNRANPNFITDGKVSAKTVFIDSHDRDVAKLKGSIICIENADPGYDWIFAHNIVGLVTKYGGANSHMAIRCAEFHLPAAIGCGGQYFNAAISAGGIDLDCESGRIALWT